MTSEQVLTLAVRRYVIAGDRPFQDVMDAIHTGISRPDIEGLFRQLAASTSYEQFSALVSQAQGPAGLMRFLELELDNALALDPQAADKHRLVRLIAGNPVTMGTMTRHVPDAGSYAPITILIEERPDGGTRIAYDSIASEISSYHSAAASQVAEDLDSKVLGLLRQVSGLGPPVQPDRPGPYALDPEYPLHLPRIGVEH
jgi:uncharacterized protein (DUF302 family)